MGFTGLDAARHALGAGDLGKAQTLLDGFTGTDTEASVLRAEVLLWRGYVDRGRRLAQELLRNTDQRQNLRASLLFVAGTCAWELGDEKDGSDKLDRAAVIARTICDWSLLSRVQLQVLERSADSGEPYHASLPLCATVVRSVHRAGDQRVLADAHVTFARLEARAGALEQASRHLTHVHRILGDQERNWVIASARITSAIISSLQGDLQSACEAVRTAESEARTAGWLKGEAIAAANLAFFQACLGNLEIGEASLARATGCGYHSPSFEYAVRDTRVALALACRDYSASDRLWSDGQEETHGVARWYRLRATHTRVRALIQQQRLSEALALAETGARKAEQIQDSLFRYIFQLSIDEISCRLGLNDAAPLNLPDIATSSLGLIGARRRVLAIALARRQAARAHTVEASAERILTASGSSLEWHNEALEESLRFTDPPTMALDDAVALVELAGYPHVLARETYALLESTHSTPAMALVARRDTTVRCVASIGWTESQAAAAALSPDDRLRIVCGIHRDESWEVIADLPSTLDDRCTGGAIRKLVETAVTLDRYRREEKQRAALWPPDTFETDGGLWVSEQMTEVLSIARRIASSDISVLLTGETGTGKEVLARAIHRASDRSGRPFIPFSCTAVPRDMLESQLFGYRKGAFTGANDAFEGVIRAAAGGTLFLDEIAEIGPELQPKLLRFLETHEVHGLGESQPVKVDVRVIAATNGDLEALVADGRFREDLFYRLNVVRLKLPPLRERREEIPPLVDHYLREAADKQKKGRLTLDDETLEYLVLYAWPGNVRQLVNEVQRIVAYADPDSTITPALLSPEIQATRRTVRVQPTDQPEIRVRLDQPLNDAIDAIERIMVVRALDRANGNYENAAKLLGISRKGLFLKRRRWGMRRAS